MISAFKRWRARKRADAALLQLDALLTPAAVTDVISSVGGLIANRKTRYGRESDLPIPKAAIEVAFLKALRDWPEGERLELVRAAYLMLDELMLSDDDAEVLNEFSATLLTAAAEPRLERVSLPERWGEAWARLEEKAKQRPKEMDAIKRARSKR